MSFHLHSLHYAGAADRFTKNIDAITLLSDLEQSGRAATDAERERLAHFSAFGESALLNRLVRYDATQRRYVVHPQYAAILSNDELTQLRHAALTAFYTPLDVIAAIWSGLLQLGIGTLDRLRVIEPAFGVGHFFSAMPQDLRARADVTAVELDPITARIAAQIHPDITLHNAGFEAVDLPANWFDVAISNVPFGDMPVHDAHIEPALRRTIHDYFFAKAVRIVRPGGVIAFLTSWGTLDKKTPTLRHWLARHCELLGAYRLPNGVFAAMSGSASATDLVILRKRSAALDQPPADAAWLDLAWAPYPVTHGGAYLTTGSRYRDVDEDDDNPDLRIPVNALWLNEPERVLGRPAVYHKQGALWFQVVAPDANLGTVLHAQLADTLPAAVLTPEPVSVVADAAPAPCFLHERDDQLQLPADLDPARQARYAALGAIYTTAKALIRSELDDGDDVDLLRARLNRVYDDYVVTYGCVSDPRTQRVFRDLPELSFLLALEANPHNVGDTWCADKEPIFFRHTLRPVQRALAGTLTPLEALLRCLDERGALDMARIAHLCGHAIDTVVAALGDRIYRVPGTTTYELADVYLSGNVRTKLRDAQTWLAHDVAYQRNVDALAAVQPTDLGAGDIIVNLHSVWLPGDVLSAFVKSLFPEFTGRVFYMHALAQWQVVDADALKYSFDATTKWGTGRANALTLLEASLKGVPITVYDEIKEENTTRRVLNPSETVAAQAKQSELRTAFDQWIWADADRSERLCRLYNERFNCIRLRDYDGTHLTFPGMATHLLRGGDLEAYQKGAVWQMLQNPSTLLAFDVGGGKTWTSTAAMMEAKRMGLINKPLVVVPNNLVAQWASEVQRLYPGSRVLAMGPEDFEKAARGTVLSRIATGTWDMIIIAHTSFKFLPLGSDVLDAFIRKETDRLWSYLEELRATGNDDTATKRSLKQIEKTITRYEARLATMSTDIKRDNARVITWRELGIDALVVDEAHCFPYDTPVLTDRGWLPIGKIVDERIPAQVLSCNTATHALEWKPITQWFYNPQTAPMVRVEHAYGSFECTANHKIWTEEDGYVQAGHLQPYHHLQVLRETRAVIKPRQASRHILQPPMRQRVPQGTAHGHQAVRAVWPNIFVPVKRRAQQRKTEVLRQFMRGTVALSAAGTHGTLRTNAWADAWCDAAGKEKSTSLGTYEGQQSNAQSRVDRKDAPSPQGTYLFGARRQRNADATTTAPGTSHGICDGVCHCNSAGGRTISVASSLLQGGPCRSIAQTGDRGGRPVTPVEEMALPGQAQNRRLERARVVGITVLEPASAGGSSGSAGTHPRVYCLEVADHHNFFADGVLVSNCFKNLFVETKLTNIAGLPRANSQRALDMRIKTWDLLNQGGKVVFLTATPIMNTLGEAYVMQLYLQERDLEAAGIHHFDEWVSLYAEAVMSFEMKPDGSGFRMNTRLGAFVNLPEMSAMWRQCMTIRTKAQMRLPEPSQVTGKPIPVEVPASASLKAFVRTLAARADRIAHGQIDPSVDNMLKITHEGRMAALDYRLIAPGAQRRKHNKIMACVKRVKAVYDTFEPLKGTQLIFCDLATPKGGKDSSATTRATSAIDGDAEAADDRGGETEAEQHVTNFVYHEIRAELGTLGIPAHEVAFIHDAKTKAQRDALFAAMNEGRVRVLIGSTNKMSAGMNVQKRLVAEHNLDCPWRPGDLKQRYGRILRQGNVWPTVYIFTYVTPGSFDGYLWQLVEAKARFIEQGLAGEITARRVEDTSDVVLSAAEVKAIASGNPLVVKKVKLETELSRLERIRSVQKSSINEFGWKRRSLERDIADLHARRTVVEAACTILAAHPCSDDSFEALVATQLGNDTFTPFTQRKEAGQAIRTITDGYHHAALMMCDNLKRVVGRYRGLDITLWAHRQGETQLSFTLPDNHQLITGFGATTELGVFQSADYQLGRVHVATVNDRIADRMADLAAIDDEVARLQVWDQQHQYDDMQEELRLLNAELSVTKDAAPASDPAAEDAAAALAGIADLLNMDAETEADWASPISIPLAFEAMTFMHAEVQAQAERVATPAAMAVGQTTAPQPGAALRLLDHVPAAVPSVQLPTTASTRAPAPAATPVWNEVPVTSKKTKQPVAVQYSMF